jgi:ABC-type nitrate/sulfonate/bicarbonate transport system substrate-binding protein
VGEPWGTLATETNTGCCVARSGALEPFHPEKVLLLRQELLEERREECLALTAALLEGCDYCADPANTGAIADLLAAPKYLGISRAVIAESLQATDPASGRRHLLFSGPDVNDPSLDKAGNLARRLRQAGLLEPAVHPTQLGQLFRSDLFQTVVQENPHIARNEIKSENEIANATS